MFGPFRRAYQVISGLVDPSVVKCKESFHFEQSFAGPGLGKRADAAVEPHLELIILLPRPPQQVYCVKCQMFCITPENAQGLHRANREVVEATNLSRPGHETSTSPSTDDPSSVASSVASWSAQGATQASREQRRRDEADERMADRMLMGWTMLADACPVPGCNFPLMLDTEGSTTCVMCLHHGPEGRPDAAQAECATDAPVRPPLSPARARSDGLPESKGEEGAKGDEGTKEDEGTEGDEGTKVDGGVLSERAFAVERRKRDEVSSVLGQFMLRGWSLLEETCSRQGCDGRVPLLRERGTSTLYCAGCDTYDRGASANSPEPTGPPESALPMKRDSSGEERNLLKGGRSPASKVELMEVRRPARKVGIQLWHILYP